MTMQYLRKTDLNNLDLIQRFINAAYRGTGEANRWTTEAHLVEGNRIELPELIHVIESADTQMLVGYLNDQPRACIAIKFLGDGLTEFGLFAVDPELHAHGYGKALLNAAEDCARADSRLFQVVVVDQNTHLIQFYKKRGYEETGEILPYPINQGVGTPKVPLELVVLQKKP